MKLVLKKRYYCKCGHWNGAHDLDGRHKPENHGRGEFDKFVIESQEFCCDKMEEAFDGDYRFIGLDDFERDMWQNKGEVNIYK